MIKDFAELIAPISVDEFFATYHRAKPLHIKGDANKLDAVMNWETLSQLLSQTGIWSHRSLELAHDMRKLPPQEYCRPGLDRDIRDNMLADMDKVMEWLRRGASLVANDIASLTPDMQNVATILEEMIGGKAQANLYCSWQAHPGFDTHFDTHDVYALHIAGAKRWRVYQCVFKDPITHPVFKGLPKEFHKQNHGPVSLEVTLQPGDILYIPRGWYHDALATSEATIHIAYGLTPAIGLDAVSHLFERAVHEPLFRGAVPRETNEKELAAHLAKLGDELAKLARDPEFVKRFAQFVGNYRYHRKQISLPDDVLQKDLRKAG